MILHSLQVGPLASNCYIVGCEETRQGIVIDPGAESARILRLLYKEALEIPLIVLTHYHFDHVGAAAPLQESLGATLAIHASDAPSLRNPPSLFRRLLPEVPSLKADRLLRDGERLTIGRLTLTVLHTPGHSPGSIALYIPEEGIIFSGDTLFCEGVGRTDFPGGDMRALIESIRSKLFTLPDETIVYPGHGPSTTIGWEKQHNPFVRLA